MDERDPNSYSTKDILTMFVLPALNDLRAQQITQQENNNNRFENLEAWKNKSLGAIIFIIALLIPIGVPVATAAFR